LAENVALFFKAPTSYDTKAVEKVLKKNDGLTVLKEMRAVLAAMEEWSGGALDDAVRHFSESSGRKLGDVAQPLRVALTGNVVSPPIHDTLHLLGQAESLKRIDRALTTVLSAEC
jgi:glutamyl-tRNA synthetase